jgi:NAD+ kinase
MDDGRFDRIGLAVHPRRELSRALETVRDWASGHGADVVQIRAPGSDREVAPEGRAEDCGLVIALGGDGTTLAALHAAAPVGKPVLGVACGSLGALTATTADQLDEALGRVAGGDWTPRGLPALVGERDGHEPLRAINDLVLVRDAAGQVMVEIELDGERFIRYAGDGLVCGTPLGSTAYTLAAGGPMLAPGAVGLALTPLASHGGVVPPLVTGPESRIDIAFDAGNGGARVEIDGQVRDELGRHEVATFSVRVEQDWATLVSLGEEESLVAGLRRRRIILDSPRVLARDDREALARQTS